MKKKLTDLLKKNDLPEKSNNDNSKQKNTSSQISSEGKNVEIISGALKVAKLPLLKPTVFDKGDQNDLMKTTSLKTDEDDIYNNLIEQVVNSQKKRKLWKIQFRD